MLIDEDVLTVTERLRAEYDAKKTKLELPTIIQNQQLRVVAGQSINAVLQMNDAVLRARDHRAIFHRDHTVCRLRIARDGHVSIAPVTPRFLQLHLSRSADFYKQRGDGLIQTHPDLAIAHALLAAADELGLPHLEGFVRTPTYRPDLSLIHESGYDHSTGLYYVVPPDLRQLTIPSRPNAFAIRQATDRLQQPFSEFAYKDRPSATNHLAATLALLFIHRIGRAPMYCIRAAQQAAGKTLLSQSIPAIHLGTDIPSHSLPLPHSEEWRKLLLSIGITGAPVTLFDNCTHKIESAVLAQLLTGNGIEGRLLRTNTIQTVSSRMLLIANGNNLSVGADMRRRTVWSVLETSSPTPLKGQQFRCHPFLQYLRRNRRTLFEAALTLTEGWVAAGCPPPTNVPIIANFESFCETVGGVLEFAGIPGFLGNFDEMFDEVDPTEDAWEFFLTALFEVMGSHLMTSRELLNTVSQVPALRDAVPEEIEPSVKANSPQRVGTELNKFEGRRFGISRVRILRIRDTHAKIWRWQVSTT